MTFSDSFKSTTHASMGAPSAYLSKMHQRPEKNEDQFNDYHSIQMVDPENIKICHPEKKLLIAVIVRAFQDLAIDRLKNQSIEWLTSSDGPYVWGSLSWYCEQLGFDVDKFKNRTKDIIESGNLILAYDKRKGNDFQDIL